MMNIGPLTATLYQAIDAGAVTADQDIPHSHSWGEYIIGLGPDDHTLEYIASDRPSEEQIQDIVHLVLLLKSSEEGTPGALKFTEEELDDYFNGFRQAATMLLYVKEGAMQKIDQKSLFDPDGSWTLTEDGKKLAQKIIDEQMDLKDEADAP